MLQILILSIVGIVIILACVFNKYFLYNTQRKKKTWDVKKVSNIFNYKAVERLDKAEIKTGGKDVRKCEEGHFTPSH